MFFLACILADFHGLSKLKYGKWEKMFIVIYLEIIIIMKIFLLIINTFFYCNLTCIFDFQF